RRPRVGQLHARPRPGLVERGARLGRLGGLALRVQHAGRPDPAHRGPTEASEDATQRRSRHNECGGPVAAARRRPPRYRRANGRRSAAMTAADLPLKGVRVLDLTLARAGPTCVRHLADWGADVIAVSAPDGGRDLMARDGFDYQNLHRNKRFIGLDLKTEAGHAAFLKLAERADVLVENMRAPVKHRLKIAYEDLKAINPRLVYGSISGFGQDGPYAMRAGVDQIAQGLGGLMSIT